MYHSFDTKIAEKYGIAAAVLLNHFYFWIEKNKANNAHYHDGYYWTYSSREALSNLFSYLTSRQIGYAVQKLIDDGIVITGNYNKSNYDRTLWYAITKKGYSILQNCEIKETELQNRDTEIVKPIPDIIPFTDKETDIRINNIYIHEIVDYLNTVCGTSYKASTDKTRKLINARLNEGFTVDDFKTVIHKKSREWLNTDYAKYLRPETLFGTKFESYLNALNSHNNLNGNKGKTDTMDMLESLYYKYEEEENETNSNKY